MTAWAFELAKQLLFDSLPVRWKHVQGVAERAESISGLFPGALTDSLVEAAILHDIGYSPLLAVTEFHPLDGAAYLRSHGVSARVCALVAHHSCAYREAELRGLSAELAQWSDEQTPLRDALWWADMTTTPNGNATNVYDRIGEIQNRYGPENIVTSFIRQAKPELVAAVERTEQRIRAAGLSHVLK